MRGTLITALAMVALTSGGQAGAVTSACRDLLVGSSYECTASGAYEARLPDELLILPYPPETGRMSFQLDEAEPSLVRFKAVFPSDPPTVMDCTCDSVGKGQRPSQFFASSGFTCLYRPPVAGVSVYSGRVIRKGALIVDFRALSPGQFVTGQCKRLP